jgi:ribose 5-phosphate isomerase B
MKIIMGCDHAGFAYKNLIKDLLAQAGHDVQDVGAFKEDDDDDYPDYAVKVARAILMDGQAKGILICGSSVGVSIAANKFKGIRAGVCHDTYSAHQAVEHDNTNILCMGSRVIGIELAKEIVITFIDAIFSNETRHLRRLSKIEAIERC